jgi:hypothetical protein|tara:strand:- start:21530 stop:21712 length:183 start_codon:yes stop_codon:yes gene_type:complete
VSLLGRCTLEASGPTSGAQTRRMYVFIPQQLLNTQLPPITITTLRLILCLADLALENASV